MLLFRGASVLITANTLELSKAQTFVSVSSSAPPQARLKPQTEVSFSHQENSAVNQDDFLFTEDDSGLISGLKQEGNCTFVLRL